MATRFREFRAIRAEIIGKPRKVPEAHRGIRTVKGKILETAVNKFQHPDGRTVTVVGIEHVGTRQYFEQMREVVDWLEKDGAEIRLEMAASARDPKPRNESETEAVETLRGHVGTRFSHYATMGMDWVNQNDSAMAPEPNWVFSDVPPLDIARLWGPETLLRQGSFANPVSVGPQLANMKSKGKTIRLRNYRWGSARLLARRGRQVKKDRLHASYLNKAVMYAYRECEEMLKVLVRDGDTALVWGAPHMQGFAEILVSNGFKLVRTKWYEVLRTPRWSDPLTLRPAMTLTRS
jgi:hypothetical protein